MGDGARDVALSLGEIAQVLLNRRVVGLPPVRLEEIDGRDEVELQEA